MCDSADDSAGQALQADPGAGISRGKLALTAFGLADDVVITASEHVVRHSPYVNRPGTAEYADMNGRGVWTRYVEAPLPDMAEDWESADIDADALRYVDIDVAGHCEQDHRGLWAIDCGFAQVEVQISERARGEGPAPQPEPSPDDMGEQGRREPGGLAARMALLACLTGDLGQIFPDPRQFRADPRAQGCLDTLGEFLQRQTPCKQVLAKRDDRLLAIGIRDAQGRIVVHSPQR
jgi:hypothetical protein